ncbi:MAG: hypothetical protein Ta2G_05400 [Termitinemataceae bacterium]|nr:MAG: hypothetical protein Ta2G_05400 [Termitinemataceae bacterium]
MKNIIFVVLALITFNLYGQELPVAQVIAQKMIIDKKNPLRYIPLNIISNNNNEVFATSMLLIDITLPEQDNIPFGEETFSYDGKSQTKKSFKYSGTHLVEENIDGGKSSYTKTYFYENGVCVAEYEDRKGTEKRLYKNIYENNILKASLLVYFEEHGHNRSLSTVSPAVYLFVFKDGKLVEKMLGDIY